VSRSVQRLARLLLAGFNEELNATEQLKVARVIARSVLTVLDDEKVRDVELEQLRARVVEIEEQRRRRKAVRS
jgi:hypothetical protein